ncbi:MULTISPECIES: ABC transporter substrate-binding protein [unclassified Coleofasciculus]|uniref:ABC transporter substrate-binding protein n=1 Tax=unclassified Coleofasciculus TaxID=2692782 RepID=UPI001881F7AC|nr:MULTISPECIES: ABC transporter substrate-binding protein [unclassified Coleofasciculus]MBE9126690.1 ABC transporter substrate-binding protein [Coleofasciculus sp. LEGE 07081]MBE9150784.1 ABC transporter substrate-binding protein [Coleofasciculus sp. LEGE 07092]
MIFAIFRTVPLRRWFLGILTCISAIAFSGCNPAFFVSEAAQKSQLVTSSLSDPATFNYALSQESSNIFPYTYEGLVAENGVTGEIQPALAESWEISEDQQRIVFTLREGLKWSDGEPLTVDDVVFTYNDIYLNEDIPTDIRDILRIGETGGFPNVQKLDERRVEFTTPEPFAPFLRTTGLAILPAHALRDTVNAKDQEGKPQFLTTWGVDTDPNKIIVNGPYQLERYNTSQRVVLRRNPYYWRESPQGKPQPYIDRIISEIVESTDTAFLQFRSGGLDALGVSPEFFSLLKQEEDKNNFTIYTGGPTLSSSFISFNLNKGSRNGKPLIDPVKSRWFNSLEFRQAVAYAIDRKTMIDNLYRGLGEPQYSNLPIQSPYYLSPEDGLTVYDYNLQKAKELLLKAGFTYNNEGQLLDAEGNRVRFTLITNAGNKLRESMGAQIKRDLGKIGIQVDFTPIAFNTMVEKLTNTLDWEVHLLGFSGGGLEPNNSANVWSMEGGLHSFNQKPTVGQPPIQGWEVAPWEQKINDLYVQGAQELDEEKRKAIYSEAQRLIKENLPYIYLVNPLSMTAVRDRVEGIDYSALGGAFWNIHELKLVDD